MSAPKEIQRLVAKLPANTLSAERFAWTYQVGHDTIRHQIMNGHIKAVEIPWKGRVWRYLTPAQQRQALAFWRKRGTWLRIPPLEVKSV